MHLFTTAFALDFQLFCLGAKIQKQETKIQVALVLLRGVYLYALERERFVLSENTVKH